MEKLQHLPNVAFLSKRVCRILGQNPGKFTLQGTNTYLVGERAPYILIDTGEGLLEYMPILEKVLRSKPKDGAVVATTASPNAAYKRVPGLSDVIITHHHRDHFGGLSDVLCLAKRIWDEAKPSSDDTMYAPPKVHKFPLPDAHANVSGPSQRLENEAALQRVLSSLPRDSFSMPEGQPRQAGMHSLSASQTLQTHDKTATLSIIHTPGHTPDSICIFLHEEQALFSADSVLGQGTAVFEDLGAYMTSLRNLLALSDGTGGYWEFRKLYPGHGPVVEDGPSLIKTYITHRTEREEQIIDLLKRSPPGPSSTDHQEDQNVWSVKDIVSVIYKEYPENLWLPAAHSIVLHLKKLHAEGRVKAIHEDHDNMSSKWSLIAGL